VFDLYVGLKSECSDAVDLFVLPQAESLPLQNLAFETPALQMKERGILEPVQVIL
jgi:hypothetical protein